MKNLLVAFIILVCQTAESQTIIYGTVTEQGSADPIADVLITVYLDGDSLVTVTTDEMGQFSFDSLVLIPERIYVVKGIAECYKLTPITIILPKATHVTLNKLEWSGMRLMDCPNLMRSFRFEPFSDELNESFELESLKDLLKKYESMELTMMLFQIPNESIELGQKRIQVFRKLMIDQHIDLTRLTIDSEIHWMPIDQFNQENQLSSFQGKITKM